MEGNDIGITYHERYAVKFEGLLMYELEPEESEPVRRGLWQRLTSSTPEAAESRKQWRPHDLPLRSLLHHLNQLHVNMDVITYMDPKYVPVIEDWLARKGAHVQVYAYADPWEWAEDLRHNPEIKRYYTDDENERDIIGFQHVTVVRTSQAWGL